MTTMQGEEMRRRPMIAAYYAVLNDDPNFVADLHALDDAIGVAVRTGPIEPYARYLPLQEFVTKWHLPEDRGWLDLYWCLRDQRVLTWSGGGEAVPEGERITPQAPASFMYDPGTMSNIRARAKEEGARVRKNIMEQAEAIETAFKQQGHRRIAPAHRNPGLLRAIARRLFRRAVLGLTYAQIAAAESDDPDARGVVGEDTIRHSVDEWAEVLAVRLPEV